MTLTEIPLHKREERNTNATDKLEKFHRPIIFQEYKFVLFREYRSDLETVLFYALKNSSFLVYPILVTFNAAEQPQNRFVPVIAYVIAAPSYTRLSFHTFEMNKTPTTKICNLL